jgi:hypothetical protein
MDSAPALRQQIKRQINNPQRFHGFNLVRNSGMWDFVGPLSCIAKIYHQSSVESVEQFWCLPTRPSSSIDGQNDHLQFLCQRIAGANAFNMTAYCACCTVSHTLVFEYLEPYYVVQREQRLWHHHRHGCSYQDPAGRLMNSEKKTCRSSRSTKLRRKSSMFCGSPKQKMLVPLPDIIM